MSAGRRPGAPIRLSDLSVYNRPPGQYLMVLLKSYLDDSGDPKDPQHTILTVAGYLSTVDSWNEFEDYWQATLEMSDVPYLHMRELWNREGKFKHLTDEKGTKQVFLSDCVQVISRFMHFCSYASINLPDLRAFNKETGLDIEPRALAIYGCLVEMRKRYPKEELHIILDKFDKPQGSIDLALQYAASDSTNVTNTNAVLITPLPASDSFRNVVAIDVAPAV